MTINLDFEQPLIDLEGTIDAYLKFCHDKALDDSTAIDLRNAKLPAVRDAILSALTPWDKVQLARHPQRPYPMDLANLIFTDFLELHGDRRYADDRAIIGGFAKLDGMDIMLIATQKGRNLKQNIESNFGSAHPEGYRKALRLMKLADKAGCPVICLLDTPGAYPGVGAEERHIGEAIAENLREMFKIKVPVISVITGEGGSGGALGLAIANKVLVMQYAYYSVITPEGCSAILWRTDACTPKAAEALKLTSDDLLNMKVTDKVVPEPVGGAHRDWSQAAVLLKNELLYQLQSLGNLSAEALLAQRYDRFRALGIFREQQHASFTLRPATRNDVKLIFDFFQPFILKKQILPRSLHDINKYLENITVAVDKEGVIIGTIALRDFKDGLHEIRSLAVSDKFEGHGIGSALIREAISLAKKRNGKRVFTLTMRPKLFQRQGFAPVSIMRFPQKVQKDCLSCPKKEQCDEIALSLDILD